MTTALTFPPVTGDFLVLPGAVHDGDTFHFYYLLGGVCRLRGVNAPELNTPTGPASRDYLTHLMPKGVTPMTLYGMDKYGGRVDADILLPSGKWLSQAMVDAGQALPWDGKGPRPIK